jgi:hypothetical protein
MRELLAGRRKTLIPKLVAFEQEPGRQPRLLLLAGYQQVRSVVAAIVGDDNVAGATV